MFRIRMQKKEISTSTWKKLKARKSVNSFSTSMILRKLNSTFQISSLLSSSRTQYQRQIAEIIRKTESFIFKTGKNLVTGDEFWLVINSKGVSQYFLSENDVFRVFGQVFRVRRIGKLENSHQMHMKTLSVPDLKNGGIGKKIRKYEKTLEGGLSERENFCRICFGTDETLDDAFITPCACSGTMGSIHISCFKRWMQEKFQVSIYDFYKTITWNDISCEICQQSIPESFTYCEYNYDQLSSFYPDGRFIVLEKMKNNLTLKNEVLIIDLENIERFFISSDARFMLNYEKISHSFVITNERVALMNYTKKISVSVLIKKHVKIRSGDACLMINGSSLFWFKGYKKYSFKSIFCKCFNRG